MEQMPEYGDWSRAHDEEDQIVDDNCLDGALPDGERCPRCGGARGPSGVDGGSWVHIRPNHNSTYSLSTRIFNYQQSGEKEHLFSIDYDDVDEKFRNKCLAAKKKFNLVSEKTGKWMKMKFVHESHHGITYGSEETLADESAIAVYFHYSYGRREANF